MEAGWWEAGAQQESDLQVAKRIRKANPDNAYLDSKGAWQLKPQQLKSYFKTASNLAFKKKRLAWFSTWTFVFKRTRPTYGP